MSDLMSGRLVLTIVFSLMWTNISRIAAANAGGKSYFPVTEAHNRFWIPQAFIDESKGAIKQNPGY